MTPHKTPDEVLIETLGQLKYNYLYNDYRSLIPLLHAAIENYHNQFIPPIEMESGDPKTVEEIGSEIKDQSPLFLSASQKKRNALLVKDEIFDIYSAVQEVDYELLDILKRLSDEQYKITVQSLRNKGEKIED
jgi:hypothetical protein